MGLKTFRALSAAILILSICGTFYFVRVIEISNDAERLYKKAAIEFEQGRIPEGKVLMLQADSLMAIIESII